MNQPYFSRELYLFLVWVIGGTIAYMLASYSINAILVDGQYIPYGPDAFYHARRIIHLLETGELLQFDPNVNAPYGDFISWPWGFDYLVALLIKVIK
ncbi:MAG: hypothetical protein O7D86_14580 [Proteobacteria bacterium]|nr:hypothetical protein [Pseudomonadota bacterium]